MRHADNPITFTFPGLAWRWHRALTLFSTGRRGGRSEEVLVREAVKYLKALVKVTSAMSVQRLQRQRMAMLYAHLIFIEPKGLVRGIIEWRLARNEPIARIAKLNAVSPEVISMYAALFFDRSRLLTAIPPLPEVEADIVEDGVAIDEVQKSSLGQAEDLLVRTLT